MNLGEKYMIEISLNTKEIILYTEEKKEEVKDNIEKVKHLINTFECKTYDDPDITYYYGDFIIQFYIYIKSEKTFQKLESILEEYTENNNYELIYFGKL